MLSYMAAPVYDKLLNRTVLHAHSDAAPSGTAGGDLSGTYPDPSVVNDSHSHTVSTITDLAINYLLLSGGIMTGLLTLDDLGETFTDAVSLPTAAVGLRGKVLLVYGTDLASWNSTNSNWDSTTTNWDSTFPVADTLYLCQYNSATSSYAWSALN